MAFDIADLTRLHGSLVGKRVVINTRVRKFGGSKQPACNGGFAWKAIQNCRSGLDARVLHRMMGLCIFEVTRVAWDVIIFGSDL